MKKLMYGLKRKEGKANKKLGPLHWGIFSNATSERNQTKQEKPHAKVGGAGKMGRGWSTRGKINTVGKKKAKFGVDYGDLERGQQRGKGGRKREKKMQNRQSARGGDST